MLYSVGILKTLGKAFIAKNGYSGEYAPAFSNKLHKGFLNQPLGEG